MQKIKKVMALLLSMIMVIGMSVGAFGDDSNNFSKKDYKEYTVNLTSMSELSPRLHSASNNDLIADELAQRNISIAKNYMLSLDLGNKGAKNIERHA